MNFKSKSVLFFSFLPLFISAFLYFSATSGEIKKHEPNCSTDVLLISENPIESPLNTTHMHTNVFGEKLIPCCYEPMTGYFRDGFCRTDDYDRGRHVVCAVMTEEFLEFTKAMGNDLSTPRPEFRFPGLKPGDKWCLCALRWKEAHEHGKAPLVVLEACDEEALKYVELSTLVKYAYKVNQD